MTKAFGWGIPGPGRIATLTTRGPLMNLADMRRVAVGSQPVRGKGSRICGRVRL